MLEKIQGKKAPLHRLDNCLVTYFKYYMFLRYNIKKMIFMRFDSFICNNFLRKLKISFLQIRSKHLSQVKQIFEKNIFRIIKQLFIIVLGQKPSISACNNDTKSTWVINLKKKTWVMIRYDSTNNCNNPMRNQNLM